MNPIVPGLSQVSLKHTDDVPKMCAGNDNSKINILDGIKQIKKKINSTYCLEGDSDDNTLMVLAEKVIFPIADRLKLKFIIKKPEKWGGGVIEYDSFEQVKSDFIIE